MQRAPTSDQDQRDRMHGRQVAAMFGRIAGWYDFLNHALSLGLDVYWRGQLARLVRPGPTGRVLDLAAGTLDVALELRRQRPGLDVLAMDFSHAMLARGKSKLIKRGERRILLAQADGRALPLPSGSVDCVTIAFGIRNILPRQAAYAEILRVLAPGGRLCILEFGTGRSRIWRGVYNFYLLRVLPTVGRLVSGDAEAYRYLADTILAFPHADALEQELRDAGFATASCRALTSGIVYLHMAEKAAND